MSDCVSSQNFMCVFLMQKRKQNMSRWLSCCAKKKRFFNLCLRIWRTERMTEKQNMRLID